MYKRKTVLFMMVVVICSGVYFIGYIQIMQKHKILKASSKLSYVELELLSNTDHNEWNSANSFSNGNSTAACLQARTRNSPRAFTHIVQSETVYPKQKDSHSDKFPKVAIASALTSSNTGTTWYKRLITEKFPLFHTFIPSFCRTCSSGYDYHFYFAYDFTDPFFNNTKFLRKFKNLFAATVTRQCSESVLPGPQTRRLHMINCSHTKHPAWAQNDAVMEAYLDGIDYFYRINDDSWLITPNWTDKFVTALSKLDPPFVGVVGPQHSGGITNILTYDFTSSTHQDIFGFHYPRDFIDWYADNWITDVYKDTGRARKLSDVKLQHTISLGQRYNHTGKPRQLGTGIHKDQYMLQRYIEHLRNGSNISRSNHLVITYSVTSSNMNITMGVLRNVQLAAVIFPEWTVRIYTTWDIMCDKDAARVLRKTRDLGAHVFALNNRTKENGDSVMMLDVANDTDVHVALVRNPLHRLDERQRVAVNEWMSYDKMFLCMHYGNVTKSSIEGMYGLKLNSTEFDILHMWYRHEGRISFKVFLQTSCQNVTMCYNADVCGHRVGSKHSPINVHLDSDLDQEYDQYMEPNTYLNKTNRNCPEYDSN